MTKKKNEIKVADPVILGKSSGDKLIAAAMWLSRRANGGYRGLVCTGKAEDRQKVVLLECEGKPSCGRWIPHTFVRVKLVRLGEVQGKQVMYRCTRCGQLRLFGLEVDKPEAQIASDLAAANSDSTEKVN